MASCKKAIERIPVTLPVLLLLIALGGGCAGRRAPTTAPAPKPHTEVGLASWYGKQHHGKRTASGERFDMYDLTAAHRALPFGSIVRVENLENGRSVKVRINDRGPFRDGRIIDLSQAAAQKLGMIRSGTARVEVTVIERG